MTSREASARILRETHECKKRLADVKDLHTRKAIAGHIDGIEAAMSHLLSAAHYERLAGERLAQETEALLRKA